MCWAYSSDEDIETNPDQTYNIEIAVQGSFHQENRELFDETVGIQCTCNSLYALCWVQIKQIFHCSQSDLDQILVEGGCFCKSLGTLDMLSGDQVPRFVKIFSHNIPVCCVRLEIQLATLTFGDPFLRDVFRENVNNASTTLYLLFVVAFIAAIIS